MGDAWVKERMASMGVELSPGSSADLGAFVKSELTPPVIGKTGRLNKT
jgi:hypothetical protein